jgi:PhzF family phenazine biosynthesis protein
MQPIPYYHVDVFTDKPLSGNGLTIFTEAKHFSKSDMQRLTQEMRQFESIFLHQLPDRKVRAFVFTCEEELDFAGHPVLGAAATLHDLLPGNAQQAEWCFVLNEKEVTVITERKGPLYKTLMNQGEAVFGQVLDAAETNMILDCMNLQADDLYPGCLPAVVSTGLPYLLIPLQQNGLKAKIQVPDLEERMKPWGAKFIGTLEIPSLTIRTWDNAGTVEDVATGSLAGPSGAYLVKHGYAAPNTIIQLNQGGNIGRPSQLFVEVRILPGGGEHVYVGGNVCKIAHGFLAKELMESQG